MRSPTTVLVKLLADSRRAGGTFADAWPGALSGALAGVQESQERGEWASVLGGMVATWRDAFERVPADGRERALATVAQDPDRQPMPDRPCERERTAA
jgi:hypothetical protein